MTYTHKQPPVPHSLSVSSYSDVATSYPHPFKAQIKYDMVFYEQMKYHCVLSLFFISFSLVLSSFSAPAFSAWWYWMRVCCSVGATASGQLFATQKIMKWTNEWESNKFSIHLVKLFILVFFLWWKVEWGSRGPFGIILRYIYYTTKNLIDGHIRSGRCTNLLCSAE